MIPEPKAQVYVKDFAAMKGFPKETDEHFEKRIELLVDHFHRAAQSDEHARRMVDWIQQHKRFSPEPVDIWDAAKATSGANITEGDKPKYRECPTCCEGWETVLVHAKWSNDKRPAGYVMEKIAEGIPPHVTEHALFSELMRYLTQQQYDRLEFLRGTWPASHHSRFTVSTQRCSRCWGGKAA